MAHTLCHVSPEIGYRVPCLTGAVWAMRDNRVWVRERGSADDPEKQREFERSETGLDWWRRLRMPANNFCGLPPSVEIIAVGHPWTDG